jgi:hypothetical protein
MKASWRNRVFGWVLVAVFLAAIVLLVWFVPVVAAVIFVALVAFVAVAIGKAEGFRNGLNYFIKEILFGW